MLWMTGCVFGDDENIVPLADLTSPRLVIALGNPEPYLSVELDYDRTELGPCAILGRDFTARVAGVDIPITRRGGADPYADSEECQPALMWLWVRPEVPAAILELGDTSRMIRCDLGDALQPRGVDLDVAPPPPLFSRIDCGGVENLLLEE